MTLSEVEVDPARLVPMSTQLMEYYRECRSVDKSGEKSAPRFYEAMKRAQAYLVRMSDLGATIIIDGNEIWTPSLRDETDYHHVDDTDCDCEGHRFNHAFCVHQAVFDCVQAVINGKEMRRV